MSVPVLHCCLPMCLCLVCIALQLAFARNQYIASEGTMLVVMVTASGMSSFDYNFTVVPSNQTAQGEPAGCPLGHMVHCAIPGGSCVISGHSCIMPSG